MTGPDTDNAGLELAALELRRAEDSRRIDELEARVALNREVILELQGDGLVAREHVQNLEAALESARVIGAAVGIVMAEYRCTQADAFETLKKASQDHNVKLRRLAEGLVLTGDVGALRSLVS